MPDTGSPRTPSKEPANDIGRIKDENLRLLIQFSVHEIMAKELKTRLGSTVIHSCEPALGKLRQEDHTFQVSMDYKVKPCLNNKQKRQS